MMFLSIFDLGPHAAFIWWSYGFAGLILALLILWVFRDERKQHRLLKELEEQGISRRSRRSTGRIDG